MLGIGQGNFIQSFDASSNIGRYIHVNTRIDKVIQNIIYFLS